MQPQRINFLKKMSDNSFEQHVAIDDFVVLRKPPLCVDNVDGLCCNTILGLVVACGQNNIEVKLFSRMTLRIIRRHAIQPLHATDHPTACAMVEVFGTETRYTFSRDKILDVAFVLPLSEVESGNFFLAGAANCFVCRYIYKNEKLESFGSSYYFSRRPVEPLSLRFFSQLNALAGNLKKMMFHAAESQISMRSFRLSFSSEAFYYLRHKLPMCIQQYTSRKQAVTAYLPSLRMMAMTKETNRCFLRVLTTEELQQLRKILGTSVGIGLAKNRPSKKRCIVDCTIGSIMTSVEVGHCAPEAVLAKPLQRVPNNGIDFVFTDETRQLLCNIRYTKLVVEKSEVATSRITTANVLNRSLVAGAYVNCNFHYNNVLFRVLRITEDICHCISDNDDDEEIVIELPLGEVHGLVALFGW
jgi:hypothetical protein